MINTDIMLIVGQRKRDRPCDNTDGQKANADKCFSFSALLLCLDVSSVV